LFDWLKKRNEWFAEPDLKLPENMHELSRDEIMEAWWKVYYNLKKKDNGKRLRISWENYENTFAAIHFGQGGGPLLLHLSMFL